MEIDRRELYDQIWATPASQLCRKFGISDVGLAKLCKRYSVPRPPRGYWAKKRNGKPTRRLPLPPDPDETPSTIEIHPTPPREKKVVSPAAEKRITAEKATGPAIVVRVRLNAPHPLVDRTRDRLGSAKPDYHLGLLRPNDKGCLDVAVGPESVDRSMRIMDALLRALEARGYRVRVDEDVYRPRTLVEVDGETIPIRLTERVRMKPRPPSGTSHFRDFRNAEPLHAPTGDLRLQILRDSGSYAIHTWQCKARKPIEDQLKEFVVGLVEQSEELKARRERARLERLDQERRRRIREEEERLRREEEDRVRWVEATLDSWRRGRDLARMIQDARDRASDVGVPITPESRLGKWIEVAERRVAMLDPLAPMLAELQGLTSLKAAAVDAKDEAIEEEAEDQKRIPED